MHQRLQVPSPALGWRIWKEGGFEPEARFDYMMSFLMFHGRDDVIGSYYHNKHLNEWTDNPDGMKAEYNKRASIEAFHGHLKQQMNLETFLDKRGMSRAEMHVLLTYISLLCVALCRIQHGVTDGLVNVKCLV